GVSGVRPRRRRHALAARPGAGHRRGRRGGAGRDARPARGRGGWPEPRGPARCGRRPLRRPRGRGPDLLALAFDLCGGRDANGAIGRDALGAGLRKLGLGCTEEEVLELMKEFDLDGDGKLCEEELAALVGV
ncbi:unnamed protein product, partial [Prorocentrum cordatum]